MELKTSQTMLQIMTLLIIISGPDEHTTMSILCYVHKFWQYQITKNNKNESTVNTF